MTWRLRRRNPNNARTRLSLFMMNASCLDNSTLGDHWSMAGVPPGPDEIMLRMPLVPLRTLRAAPAETRLVTLEFSAHNAAVAQCAALDSPDAAKTGSLSNPGAADHAA